MRERGSQYHKFWYLNVPKRVKRASGDTIYREEIKIGKRGKEFFYKSAINSILILISLAKL